MTQADLLAYSQIREMEEHKSQEALMGAMFGG